MYLNSFLTHTFRVLQESLLIFFQFYSFLITARLTLVWFPNFNPFTQPYYSVTLLTDPYIRIFRGLIPRILNIDISPIFAVLWVQSIVEILTELVSNY